MLPEQPDAIPVPDLASVFLSFSSAIRSMGKPKVPPPRICDGLNYDVADFYFFFERFAGSVYGDDQISWLQVLPEFLAGNPKDIVEAFGTSRSNSYDRVKDIVLKHSRPTSPLCGNEYLDFFATSRKDGESLLCFSLRLHTRARKIPGTTSSMRHALVRDKLLKSLSQEIRNQLDVKFCLASEISVEEIVGNATIFERTNLTLSPPSAVTPPPSPAPAPLPVVPYSPPSLSVHSCRIHTRSRRDRKCWKCGSLSHLKNACPGHVARSAKLPRCYDCQGRGHVARNCPDYSPQERRVHFSEDVQRIPSEKSSSILDSRNAHVV